VDGYRFRGIETVEQAVALSKIGAQQGQGFLFGRPMPIGEARRAAKPNDRSPRA
jgi:EAL domain-containing protein (putative c-di-GMP-specific phosphodiesterase class I)